MMGRETFVGHCSNFFHPYVTRLEGPNGLRYWRWGGLGRGREQKKLEARKMLENAAESPASSARFVGWRFSF